MADGASNTSSSEPTTLVPKASAVSNLTHSKFKGRTSVYGNGGDVNNYGANESTTWVSNYKDPIINDMSYNTAGGDVNIQHESPKAAKRKCRIIVGSVAVVVVAIIGIILAVVLTRMKQNETGECASIKQIPNREVYCTNQNKIGSNCTFSCFKGKLTQGPAKVTCLASKQWSDKLPVCECPPCTAGPECRTIDWNKLVTYTDLSEKIYYGSHEIECISKGRWRWRGFKSKWVYHGTCTDINTRETHTCKYLPSSSTSKEHALANLIKNGQGYPTPCNEQGLLYYIKCEH